MRFLNPKTDFAFKKIFGSEESRDILLPAAVNRFKLRAKANPEICQDDLELVFAELPKFTLGESELATVRDKWLYFLKTAPDLSAVPPVLAQEPAIAHAFGIANKAGLTPEELDGQERREIFIQDQRGALSLAEQRGRAAKRDGGRSCKITFLFRS